MSRDRRRHYDDDSMRVVAGVPPGPGGSCPGQFLAPETQHDIGGVGDALGMRHHDHAFAELMGGVLQQMNHLVGHLRVEAARRLVREDRAARGDQRAADRHPLALTSRRFSSGVR